MENQNERVMAYTLAKQISHEELSDVSGGAALKWSQGPTFKASGQSGQWDTFMDYSVDF